LHIIAMAFAQLSGRESLRDIEVCCQVIYGAYQKEVVMDVRELKSKLDEVIAKHGPWTAHNIHLTGDLYTIEKRITGDEIKLRRILQIVADTVRKPLRELRVLDLACLEGLYSIELARQGANAVGIEARETNIAKARFAKEVLGLENVTFIQDDVRNLSREKHGEFDVVLCLGILYHLDVPDVFTFLEQIGRVSRGIAIIDTHIGLSSNVSCQYKGKTYWGVTFKEHEHDSTPEERKKQLWASLDNVTSFWPTHASLCNALSQVGFTSVYECRMPAEPDKPRDRLTLMAVKGQRQNLISSPLLNSSPLADMPEQSESPYPDKQPGVLSKTNRTFPQSLLTRL
jgi:SAM-dependent methyltransferase